jgi:hypothetical protein
MWLLAMSSQRFKISHQCCKNRVPAAEIATPKTTYVKCIKSVSLNEMMLKKFSEKDTYVLFRGNFRP